VAADHWGNQAAAAVLAEMYGTPPYYARVGGSIPVCELFLSALGAFTVSFAFALEDEQAHAPNEFFRLHSFRQAPVAYGKLFSRLAQQTMTSGQP
jgi:acetylornithine deacetylase/succinyl-diaminopimelate desuccinylase-like protein